MNPSLPAELRPDQVTAIVDTREQQPLDLAPLRSVAGTLATGDYSVQGLEGIVAIERQEPARPAGVHRPASGAIRPGSTAAAGLPLPCDRCRGDVARLGTGEWRSQVTPAAAVGSRSRLDCGRRADRHGRRPCPSRAVRRPAALHRGPAKVAGGKGAGDGPSPRGYLTDSTITAIMKKSKVSWPT